jgi:beta-lactam-binding protein with PASTA domain/tRNA A-37 threonylcarbamoyl transferase component Bud32
MPRGASPPLAAQPTPDDGSTEDPVAEIGTILGGRYRLVELLGQGGMATIFRAHDNQLNRDVAVKLLRPEYGRDPDFGSRFRSEAQNAASLNHPNIVSVYDYGQDTAGPFIVMELVEGEDLATIIRRSGALPPRQAARIVAEAARALQAAHASGIVHRDVKPGNILISRDGRVKVTDFGIARAIAEAQMTLPGTTLGSVHYFSPEQARGEQATAASDIFSLGIVLYELLTGRRPWEADTAAAVAMARLAGPVPDPTTVRAGIPPDLAAIDRRALATEPVNRWGSAANLAAALEAFLSGAPIPELGALGGATTVGGAAVGAAAAGAAGAGLAATARPNPAAVPYTPDAYADARPNRYAAPERAVPPAAYRRQARPLIDEDEPDDRTSPAVWAAGIVALLILAAAAFLVFRLLSGGTPPVAQTVTVPDFVGKLFTDAQTIATETGLTVVQDKTQVDPSGVIGTVVAQDPPKGTKVPAGGQVKLTVITGPESVSVPDIRSKTVAAGVQLLVAAGLAPGTQTEAFDPVIATGLIVSQTPSPGLVANKGTPVDYVVSKGPEPSPTPSPTPTPTPTPTPAPTPTPTPAQLTVNDYRCKTLDVATGNVTDDGFVVGTVTASPAGASPAPDWIVIDQNPNPGRKRPPGTAIDLVMADPATKCPP